MTPPNWESVYIVSYLDRQHSCGFQHHCLVAVVLCYFSVVLDGCREFQFLFTKKEQKQKVKAQIPTDLLCSKESHKVIPRWWMECSVCSACLLCETLSPKSELVEPLEQERNDCRLHSLCTCCSCNV